MSSTSEPIPEPLPRPTPLADLRTDYRRAVLIELEASLDPFEQFGRWFADGVESCRTTTEEPHAMTLATIGLDGRPSARTVLLKGFDGDGFVWFTNYESRKGRELAANPVGALNFRWSGLERQVNVRGFVSRVSAAESDAYFATRPLGSRIGAVASAQSQVIPDRIELERVAASLAAGPESDVVRPDWWGGFRLVADEIEFWQGRPSRLHDRLRYRLSSTEWIRERLAP